MKYARIAVVLAVAFFSALTLVRPHVAERWALYLGSASVPDRATLFLDPFPSDASCESRVKVFAANAEQAFCSGRRVLEFGTASDAILAADFDPFSPSSWFCRPRKAARIAAASPSGVSNRPASAGY